MTFSTNQPPTGKTMPSNALLVKVDQDLEELIEEFLKGKQTEIQAIQTALEQNDYQTIKQITHDMVGTGQTFGFGFITESARQIDCLVDAGNTVEIYAITKALQDMLQRVQVVFVNDDELESP